MLRTLSNTVRGDFSCLDLLLGPSVWVIFPRSSYLGMAQEGVMKIVVGLLMGRS